MLGNITRELAGRTFKHIYMTDVRSLSLAVLLMSGRKTAFKEETAQFVRELTDVICGISRLHVTVTVSKTAHMLKDIPGMYEEVKEGRHYRQFENASQVIDLSRKEDMPPVESYYPFTLEKGSSGRYGLKKGMKSKGGSGCSSGNCPKKERRKSASSRA